MKVRVRGGTLDGQQVEPRGCRVECPIIDVEYSREALEWDKRFLVTECWLRTSSDPADHARLEELYERHPKPKFPTEVYEYQREDDGTLVLVFDRIER